MGIGDLAEIAGVEFHLPLFAAVPQYYYMGADDENDALPYEDAYSPRERAIILDMLGEDMDTRWQSCQSLYQQYGICAEFHRLEGVGHETHREIDEDIVSFYWQVMEEYR